LFLGEALAVVRHQLRVKRVKLFVFFEQCCNNALSRGEITAGGFEFLPLCLQNLLVLFLIVPAECDGLGELRAVLVLTFEAFVFFHHVGLEDFHIGQGAGDVRDAEFFVEVESGHHLFHFQVDLVGSLLGRFHRLPGDVEVFLQIIHLIFLGFELSQGDSFSAAVGRAWMVNGPAHRTRGVVLQLFGE